MEQKVSIHFLEVYTVILDFIALPVEGNEATSVTLPLLASVRVPKPPVHMARVQTGPENMRLEKHYTLYT